MSHFHRWCTRLAGQMHELLGMAVFREHPSRRGLHLHGRCGKGNRDFRGTTGADARGSVLGVVIFEVLARLSWSWCRAEAEVRHLAVEPLVLILKHRGGPRQVGCTGP